jgi:hypothetical protein
MPSPATWTWILGIGAAVAIALTWLARQRRAWVAATFKESQVKAVTELVAGASPIAGTLATYTAFTVEEKQSWLWPALFGLLCWGAWKNLQYYVEGLLKSADKVDRKEFERAKAESRFRADLLAAFRSFVSRKAERTLEVVRDRTRRPRIDDARHALTPGPHLQQILYQLALFLQTRCQEKIGKGLNVRVGVYVNTGGVMTPVHSESVNQPQTDPFTSYRQHQEQYRLDTPDRPAFVVRCVRERQQILIVDDCGVAAGRGDFFFFSREQESYLKSMVAHFMGEVCVQGGTMTVGVLAIDADQPKAFEEAEREDLLLCLLEFAQRVKFEMLLRGLLEGGGV